MNFRKRNFHLHIHFDESLFTLICIRISCYYAIICVLSHKRFAPLGLYSRYYAFICVMTPLISRYYAFHFASLHFCVLHYTAFHRVGLPLTLRVYAFNCVIVPLIAFLHLHCHYYTFMCVNVPFISC